MHIYLAGNAKNVAHLIRKRLSTFAYPNEAHEYAQRAPLQHMFIMDSGAFTAWNVGKTVNLHEYATFALKYHQENKNKMSDFVIVNLDVIPGERGRDSTKQERIQAMRDSLRNADYLRSQGLPVMEVFHQDEPFEYLHQLISRRTSPHDVIGLSSRNDVHVNRRVAWYKAVLAQLLRSGHTPSTLPRFHGLAATSTAIMKAFPLYSADSASWLSPIMFGNTKGTKFQHIPSRSENVAAQNIALINSMNHYEQLEKKITALWSKRGVTWST